MAAEASFLKKRKLLSHCSSRSDWTLLPEDILDSIIDKLVSLADYVRFSAVTVWWRSVALSDRNNLNSAVNKHKYRRHQLPKLMTLGEICDYQTRAFYSVTDNKLLSSFRLPQLYNKRIIGSSLGWLIVADFQFRIALINPFSHVDSLICLPHLDGGNNSGIKFREYYFSKPILSADPLSNPDDYTVMIIYGERRGLAFIKPGRDSASWTLVNRECKSIRDVIYCNDRFYAIDVLGRVLMCDVSSAVVVTKFVSPELPEGNCRLHDKYLVESAAGNLLQVLRFLCRRRECINQYETKEIKVFKLDCQNWIELESLGDDVLFVGGNDSFLFWLLISPDANQVVYTTPTVSAIRILCITATLVVPLVLLIWVSLTWRINASKFQPHYSDTRLISAIMCDLRPIWVVPTFQEAEQNLL